MQTPICKLGKSDIELSTIIMGTWQAGREMWVGIDDNETTRAIQAAFEAGIKTFDTAEAYGKGHSERILGAAVSEFRHQIVIATKVFANHLKYDQVLNACHNSLKNLHTDYIDLYQIHWPAGTHNTKEVPIEETMDALNRLKKQGKIRAIGVSNFSRSQLEEATRFGQVDSLQSPYSLFWRQIENDALPYCREHGITLLAYAPMAQGILTGKFGPDHKFEKGDHRTGNRLFKPENLIRVQQALEKLRPVAERNNTNLARLALAWVTSKPNTCAIAGARNRDQAIDNAGAGTVIIPPSDFEEIDAISCLVTDYLDENPVMWRWYRA